MYKTAEEMQLVIDDYFDGEDIPTVAGLTLALGFCTRKSLFDYEGKEEFVNTVKRAKLRIEGFLEHRLIEGKGQVAGVIFNLKNNFSWRDRHDVDHSGEIKVVKEYFN